MHSRRTMATQSQLIAPDIEAIRAAHRRISPRIHRTPVVTSASLDELSGAKLYFKCENLQKTGSFKIRGATNAVFSLTRRRGATRSSRAIFRQSRGCAFARGSLARNSGVHHHAVEFVGGEETRRRAVRRPNYGMRAEYSHRARRSPRP